MSKSEHNDIQAKFLKAVEQEGDSLYRHSLIRVSDRETAFDLVQDTYMKSWEYISRGKDISNMRAFLFRVLNNSIIDYYRKKKSYSLESMVDEETPLEVFADLQDHSFESWANQHDGAQIVSWIADLPDMYKQALTLRFVEGFSPKEISEMIEESENVVSVRIHRGLQKLRDIAQSYDSQ